MDFLFFLVTPMFLHRRRHHYHWGDKLKIISSFFFARVKKKGDSRKLILTYKVRATQPLGIDCSNPRRFDPIEKISICWTLLKSQEGSKIIAKLNHKKISYVIYKEIGLTFTVDIEETTAFLDIMMLIR